METFTWIPDHGASESIEARVLVANFGDGYAQRAPIGINNLETKRELVFSVRPLAEIRAIDGFLKKHRGATPFEYQPPGEEKAPYVCARWQKVRATDLDSTLTATFEQVPL
jgi:phage-related protein